ncbi:MAG: glycoside hydrolase family 68 protein [Miltoncostaeaceae bacterium]
MATGAGESPHPRVRVKPPRPPTSVWRAEDLARADVAAAELPVIRPDQVAPLVAGLDLWDIAPVRTAAGTPATVAGEDLWLALSAPATGDPWGRHDIARLRLIGHGPGGWRDLGHLFPDGASPGSREWAGTAVYDERDATLAVLYTAAGGRDATTPRLRQRIVATSARVVAEGGIIRCTGWRPHREVLAADGSIYASTDADHGELGFITAFRDPFPFRDPADGREWVVFAASRPDGVSTFAGAVGLAEVGAGGEHRLAAPLLYADGVNTELERPHLVMHDGRYHLFFSTQRHTFAPGVAGPTGLYGFFAPALTGPYAPLNGSGLVLANPAAEPLQAYSWLVLPDLRVVSFVDFHSLGGVTPLQLAADGVDALRRHFGGTLAPLQRLRIDGATAAIERG